jgi:uncharacterized protein YqfB (UPF0267 family)
MAALSFKGRFVDLILADRKKQTIRNFRKYPVKPGETLYLYTGMRTKHCMKLKDVVCDHVSRIKIFEDRISLQNLQNGKRWTIRGKAYLDLFAQDDGFKDWAEMKRWWTMTHELPFVGQLITWK